MKKIGFILALIVATASPVSASTPASSPCPGDFELWTIAALEAEWPGAGDYASTKDKNQDGLICVKIRQYPAAAPWSVGIAFVDNKTR